MKLKMRQLQIIEIPIKMGVSLRWPQLQVNKMCRAIWFAFNEIILEYGLSFVVSLAVDIEGGCVCLSQLHVLHFHFHIHSSDSFN